MTVSNSTYRVSYNGNGSTTSFSIPFYFINNSDLLVTKQNTDGSETAFVLGTDYNLTGAGDLSGGTLTTTATLITNEKITIERDAQFTQSTDYEPFGRFPAETLEQNIDKLTMLSQQVKALTDRVPLLDKTTSFLNRSIEEPVPGSYLIWGLNGDIESAVGDINTSTYTFPDSNAVSRTVTNRLAEKISVKDFGAVGDGSTDDTEAIQNAFDVLDGTNHVLVFPDTGSFYKVSDTIQAKCHVGGTGTITSDGVMSNKAIIEPNTTGLIISGITLSGHDNDKSNSVTGLKITKQATFVNNLNISGYDVGLSIGSFLVSVSDSLVNGSNTNLSLFGTTGPPLNECNLVNIINSKFYSASEYASWLGDTRESGTISGAVMGAVVNFFGCDLENSCTRIGNVGEVNFIGCYFENPESSVSIVDDKHVYVDGTEGVIRGVNFEGCYFSGGKYGVYCEDSPRAVTMKKNFFNGVTVSGLYLKNEIYGATYINNTNTGSFANGQEFHTGIRSGVTSAVLHSYITDDLPRGGRPFSVGEPGSSVIGHRYITTDGEEYISTSPSGFRCYNSPSTSVSGSASSGAFTCDITSDSYDFNGGDAIELDGNSGYVRFVDYDNGIIYCEEYTASGSVDIEQISQTWARVGQTFEVLTPDTYNTAVAGKVEFGSSASTDNGKCNRFKFWLEEGGSGNANGHVCVLSGISRDSGTQEDMVYWSTAISEHPTGDKTYAPYADNDRKLGLTSRRWSECHATTYYAGSGSVGVSGSFTAASGETITVTNGIITGIV